MKSPKHNNQTFSSKEKAVVTGAAGFIGSHLVDALLESGSEVIGIDNFSVGRKLNLKSALKNKRFQLIEGDIENFPLKDIFSNASSIFHLAALADIVPSIQFPEKYHRANVDGTVSVLEAAKMAGVNNLIYAASSSCYGVPEIYPTPETALIQPMYPYALTKWIAEQYVLHWGKVFGLPVVSLRFFNVFGPRARTSGTYGAVFGVFLAQKLHGQPFTVVGDGTQTRDFTYVTDVVASIIMAANSGLQGEIMNVGSGGTYSVNYLVDLLGGPSVNIPKRPGEPNCTFANIAKIRSILGWEPQVSFEEGVQKLLAVMEDWNDAPVWDADSIKNATMDWFKHLGSNV